MLRKAPPMASIRRTPGHPTWAVRYRDPASRQHTKHFKKRADAERFANSVEADKARGHWIDPSLGKTSFGEWLEQWQASRVNLRPSTQARDDSYLRCLILPTFGRRPIGAIKRVEIRTWIADLQARGYAAATIRKASQIVSGAFNAAVADGLIGHSPTTGTPLPKVEHHEMRALTADEIQQLAVLLLEVVDKGRASRLRFGVNELQTDWGGSRGAP
jgi:hypothetical protein